ncbi:MAG: polysaccharide biosynthesis protein [Lachnospiraceae bacterium]|nr:polysaccharide biosynthesis protein [Lachnospiraceae bacterium]
MSNAAKSDHNFILQGSILAIAQIVSKIVGLLYRIPLTAIIGKRGNDYYGTAFEVYNIILIISSFSIPLAVSKLVAARIANGEARNAKKVLVGSLLFASATGGVAAFVVYFFADFFTGTLLKTPYSIVALKVLAPTLFIVAIVGVLRGFFQGLNTTMPSAISQVAEQIVNAVVSVVAAIALVGYGIKVGGVLNDVEGYKAAYGAAGGTLGTLSGAVVALLFMLLVYFRFRKRFLRKIKRDRSNHDEAYSSIIKILVLTIVPVLLSTTLFNISAIIDQGIFKNIAVAQGYSPEQISEWWGVFSGQYKVLINVPISISSSIAASAVPALTMAYERKDRKTLRSQIHSSNRFIMIFAFPCTAGLMVLAGPIMELLFADADPTSAHMLIIGSFAVIFYSISSLSNGLLQGINKLRVPVINAIIALVLHVIVLLVLMEFFYLNIHAVVIANTVYAALMCLLNAVPLRKSTHARQNIKTTYFIPAMASVIMGVVVYGAYNLLMLAFGNNIVACLVSIIIAVIVYGVLMLLMKGVTRHDLERIPKGDLIINVAEKLHLLR